MRFKNFINENSPNYDIFIKIFNDCQPFLKDLVRGIDRRDNKFLLSGREETKLYSKETIRTDRKPLHLDNIMHVIYDRAFYKKFGFRARSNVVFCTGSYFTAKLYGYVYIIFPIGKYKFIWSPEIKDLYVDGVDSKYEFKQIIDKNVESIADEYEKEIEDELKDIVNSYKKSDMNMALTSKNEIMVNCKEYYMVNYDFAFDTNKPFIKVFLEYIKRYGTETANKDKISEIVNEI